MRRFLTLIELLIALSLAAAALTFLNLFFYQADLLGKKADVRAEESFKKRVLLSSLSRVMPRIFPDRFLLSDEGGLLFDFDNGVQFDPLFSNRVIGRLFLSSEGELLLALWPEQKLWKDLTELPIKKKVLLDRVEALRFSFYSPSLGSWVEKWEDEELKLPPLVKIAVERDGEERSLIFPLNKTKARIVLL